MEHDWDMNTEEGPAANLETSAGHFWEEIFHAHLPGSQRSGHMIRLCGGYGGDHEAEAEDCEGEDSEAEDQDYGKETSDFRRSLRRGKVFLLHRPMKMC
jgi:hypothetical protein